MTPQPGSLAAYNRAMKDLEDLPGFGYPDFYNNFRWCTTEGNGEEDLNLSKTREKHSVLDLALVMDCTGSMGPWMEHCKNTLSDVIDNLKNEALLSLGKPGIVR